MKTRFCAVAIVGMAIGWLGTATAQEQNDNWHGPIQQVSGADYSVVRGSAYVSDTDQPSGMALAIDPSWISREQDSTSPGGSGLRRVPATEVAQTSDPNAPPTPPPDTDQKEGGDLNAPNSKASSGTCESCSANHCGDCCNDCCDDSCHHHQCHGVFDCCDRCPLYCCDEPPCRLFDCCCMKENNAGIYGWIDGGIMGNADSPSSHFNGPVTFPDRDDAQLNQFYGVLERTAGCNNCGWFLGGRTDLYWGSDFVFTTAAGLDGTSQGNLARWESTNSFLYGWSMPQLYAEVDYDDVQVKLGHFYSPIGYEVAPAVGNFFYSHSYARQYGEPFTHTGVLASQPIGDNWKWYAGIDNGWNAFDCNSRANFLGGLSFHDDCWGSLSFMIQTGDDGELDTTISGIGPFANRTVYSLVWERNFTSRWTYVLEHNLGVQQDAATLQGTDTAEWYGLTNYLFYRINCCWEAGFRFEWFRDDDGFAVTGIRPGNPLVGNFFAGNFYETSVGLNWKPSSNIVVRPEIRWDWFNGISSGGPPYNDNTRNHQFLFGLDAIVQF